MSKAGNAKDKKPSSRLRKWLTLNFDKNLKRVSEIGQILLVILASFAYFYTVVPIYQRDLLSEEIAKKEIELSELQLKLEEAEPHISSLKANSEKLEARISNLAVESLEAEKLIAELETTKHALQAQVDEKQKNVAFATAQTDKAFRSIYLENLAGVSMYQYLLANVSSYDLLETQDSNDIDGFLITPYEAIDKALASTEHNFIQSSSLVPQGIRETVNKEVKEKLKEQKYILNVSVTDIHGLIASYNNAVLVAEKNADKNQPFNSEKFQALQTFGSLLDEAVMKEFHRTKDFLEQFKE